jgi:hypothetical protein
MTVAAVDMLAALRAAGGDVKLTTPGRLKVVAPTRLPDELIEQLRAAKPDLLRLLRETQPVDWTDLHDERAAIAEYDGGAPRAWAEALARLDPASPPADISPRRWLRFIDDCGRFLDAGWAARAAELGWGPFDLFGCNRERPFARIDSMGLIWFCNGGSIVELYRHRAVIQARMDDARLSFRRRPVDIGRVVLAWELAKQADPQPAASLCDHCGGIATLANPLHPWAWPGRPDGIRLHQRCEEPWVDSHARV